MIRRSLLGILIEPVAKAAIAHRDKYAADFLRVFGHHLTCYWCWHGFDIETFATDYSLMDGERSIAEVIKERFGNEAVELLVKVIDVDFAHAAF